MAKIFERNVDRRVAELPARAFRFEIEAILASSTIWPILPIAALANLKISTCSECMPLGTEQDGLKP